MTWLIAAVPPVWNITGICLIAVGALLLLKRLFDFVVKLLVIFVLTILMAQLLHEIFGCKWNDLTGVVIIIACIIFFVSLSYFGDDIYKIMIVPTLAGFLGA